MLHRWLAGLGLLALERLSRTRTNALLRGSFVPAGLRTTIEDLEDRMRERLPELAVRLRAGSSPDELEVVVRGIRDLRLRQTCWLGGITVVRARPHLIAGFVREHLPPGDVAMVEDSYLWPEIRSLRAGFGTDLYRIAEQWARSRGFVAILSDAAGGRGSTSAEAGAAWRRLGATTVNADLYGDPEIFAWKVLEP